MSGAASSLLYLSNTSFFTTGTNSLGLKPGCEAIARISPLLGSIDDERAPFTILREHVLTDALKIFVKRCDDIVARNGRTSDSLGCFVTGSVISDMQLTDLSPELVVKNLLETFAAFAVRKIRSLFSMGRTERGASRPV